MRLHLRFSCFAVTVSMMSVSLGLSLGEEPKSEAAGTENSSDVNELVAGNTACAIKLYSKLKQEPGNLFFSPYSISTALAMTYGGARTETESEMAKALSFNLAQDQLHAAFSGLGRSLQSKKEKKGVELSVANALWPHNNYAFRSEYIELLQQSYDSVGTPLDYSNPEQARGVINRWVEEETKNKIKDLIPPGVLNSDTRMVLTNAIYFKGDWVTRFEKKRTREMPFKLSAEKIAKTPMMYRKGSAGFFQDAELQILEMPYQGNDVSMLVLLPRKVDGLAELEKSLTATRLAKWLKQVRKLKVDVWLPKFKMTSQLSLATPLKSLGMKRAFSRNCDFSGMDGSKRLFLSAVIHQAFVDVNEEGTEAAAATAAVIQSRSLRVGPRFRADHPFLFLIREKTTGSILFFGRYVHPPG